MQADDLADADVDGGGNGGGQPARGRSQAPAGGLHRPPRPPRPPAPPPPSPMTNTLSAPTLSLVTALITNLQVRI